MVLEAGNRPPTMPAVGITQYRTVGLKPMLWGRHVMPVNEARTHNPVMLTHLGSTRGTVHGHRIQEGDAPMTDMARRERERPRTV